MKMLLVLAIAFGVAMVSTAEEKLLVGEDLTFSAYGGPMVQITSINGQPSILTGGRGALVIGHTFIIGGGGYGFAVPMNNDILGVPNNLNFSFGGLEVGVTLGSDFVVHFTANALMGAGRAHYLSPYASTSLYVIAPHGYLEVNIASWIRLCLGGGYRFVFGVADLQGLTNSDFQGPSAELLIKFGGF